MESSQVQNQIGIEAPKTVNSIRFFGPADSKKELRLHQQRVVHAQCKNIQLTEGASLIRSRGFLLQHSLGSGKTLTAIATAANLLNVREIGGAIIVVKLKTLVQWQEALKNLWPETSAAFPFAQENYILLTTYEQLAKAVGSGSLAGGDLLEGGEEDEAFEPANENEATAEEVRSASEGYAKQENLNAIVLGDVLRGTGRYKDKLKLSESFVIYDESQRMSNLTNDTFIAKQIAEKCKKILLMSATPQRNHPKDASVAFSLITNEWPSTVKDASGKFVGFSQGWLPVETKSFEALFVLSPKASLRKFVNPATSSLYQKRVANFVSQYNVRDDPSEQSHQPQRIDIDMDTTTIFMSDEQHAIQFKLQKEATVKDSEGTTKFLNAFLNRTRQACNTVFDHSTETRALPPTITEPKVYAIVNEVSRQIQNRVFDRPSELPIMVYSEFIPKGIDRVDLRLREMQAANLQDLSRILRITGRTSPAELRLIQQRVLLPNSYDVILISGAGSEGLDTRGIRQVHVLESPWTQSDLDQALGRAIRYNSHMNLPMPQRNVKIFKWTVAKTPAQKAKEGSDVVEITADKQVYRTVQFKDELNQKFSEFLQCNSIERNIYKAVSNVCTNESSLLSNPSFPVADVNALQQFRYWFRIANFGLINLQRLNELQVGQPLEQDAKKKAIIQRQTQRLLPRWAAKEVEMPPPAPERPAAPKASVPPAPRASVPPAPRASVPPAPVPVPPKRRREPEIPVRTSEAGKEFPTPAFVTGPDGLIIKRTDDPQNALEILKKTFAMIPRNRWRKAYLTYSLDYHPDKNSREEISENAKIIFQSLSEFKGLQEEAGNPF